MTKDEALKLALEAFDSMIGRKPERVEQAITAIKEALAQPEQEPVAHVVIVGDMVSVSTGSNGLKDLYKLGNGTPLYTTPQRTWVGLTDEEIADIRLKTLDAVATNHEVYRAIQSKLKEKNL